MLTPLQAWLNERFAPELLESKSELVECMLEQMAEMEENFKRAGRGDFRVSLHSMEVGAFNTSYLKGGCTMFLLTVL